MFIHFVFLEYNSELNSWIKYCIGIYLVYPKIFFKYKKLYEYILTNFTQVYYNILNTYGNR